MEEEIFIFTILHTWRELWDNWVKSQPLVPNLFPRWFSQHQQQLGESLLMQLHSCTYWTALVCGNINVWFRHSNVYLAHIWLAGNIREKALWEHAPLRKGELGMMCEERLPTSGSQSQTSSEGTSSSPVPGPWGWHSAIKSLIALLNLDLAGSAKTHYQTSPFNLNAHTPKSYFQKQCEHLRV